MKENFLFSLSFENNMLYSSGLKKKIDKTKNNFWTVSYKDTIILHRIKLNLVLISYKWLFGVFNMSVDIN